MVYTGEADGVAGGDEPRRRCVREVDPELATHAARRSSLRRSPPRERLPGDVRADDRRARGLARAQGARGRDRGDRGAGRRPREAAKALDVKVNFEALSGARRAVAAARRACAARARAVAGCGAAAATTRRRSRAVGRRGDGRRRDRHGVRARAQDAARASERRAFQVGNSFFNRNWVTAPASTTGRDGLGPTFNAQSCSSCHCKTGAAQPPDGPRDPERGLLLRLSAGDPPRAARGLYGSSCRTARSPACRPRGGSGSRYAELRGRYGDGDAVHSCCAPRYAVADGAFGPLPRDVQISPRVAPAVFGVGLLEAVPEATVLEHADPGRRATATGSPGAPNRVAASAAAAARSRSGASAGRPTSPTRRAAERGRVPRRHRHHLAALRRGELPAGQRACARARDGGAPGDRRRKLERVTFYTRTLAVPARRDVGAPRHDCAASGLFARARLRRRATCPSCGPATATSPRCATSASARTPTCCCTTWARASPTGGPTALATGSEWRTAPLWGIGLVPPSTATRASCTTAARAASRRRSSGTAARRAARASAFRRLPARERRELVAFLESL